MVRRLEEEQKEQISDNFTGAIESCLWEEICNRWFFSRFVWLSCVPDFGGFGEENHEKHQNSHHIMMWGFSKLFSINLLMSVLVVHTIYISIVKLLVAACSVLENICGYYVYY